MLRKRAYVSPKRYPRSVLTSHVMKLVLGFLAALVALPASAAFQSSYEADSLTALYRSGGDNGAPAAIAGKSFSAARRSRA